MMTKDPTSNRGQRHNSWMVSNPRVNVRLLGTSTLAVLSYFEAELYFLLLLYVLVMETFC